jgi:restriction endonuclease S subunit
MGKTYSRAYIENNDCIAASKWSFWQREKIVIAGMTKRIEAVFVAGPLALGVGAYAIDHFGGFLPQFLVGVLNSKFLSYFLRHKFSDKHLAGGYLAINKSTLEQLPLVDVPQAEQEAIAGIVGQIMAAKDGNPGADTRSLEQEIDGRIFGLYGLTVAEIKGIESENAPRAAS